MSITKILINFWVDLSPDGNRKLLVSRKFDSKIILSIRRSSHRRCSVRKGILRNFTKFTGKHLCQSLFFNKVAGLGIIKKENLT